MKNKVVCVKKKRACLACHMTELERYSVLVVLSQVVFNKNRAVSFCEFKCVQNW